MKMPALHRSVLTAATMAFCLCACSSAMAQNLMIGFNRITCPAKSDTLVSVPFMKHPVKASGSLASAPNLSTSGQAILSLPSSGNWTTNEFKGKSYVRFTSGAKAGHWYDVIGNTDSTLTIDLNDETGSALASGDTLMVVEYWTLNTLFPPSSQHTIHVSSGTLGYQQKTKILIPNVTATGINLPAEGVYFLTSQGWKQSLQGYPSAGNALLPPGLPFIIRHPSGVEATVFEPEGRVLRAADSLGLVQSQSVRQDNTVAVLRPVDVALKDSGLDQNAFVASTSHDAAGRKDELLVFDNSAAGFNKIPSATYYKVGSAWFLEQGKGTENTNADDVKALAASAGLIIRKAQGADNGAIWTNQPTY
jgi:uncharacterized protein (TIGR02597 family)